MARHAYRPNSHGCELSDEMFATVDSNESPVSVIEHTDTVTLRRFHITFGRDGVAYMQEYVPTGHIRRERGGVEFDPRLLEIEESVGPNDFLAEASRLGIDSSAIVLVPVAAPGGCRFASIEEAVDAIHSCIARNVRLRNRKV